MRAVVIEDSAVGVAAGRAGGFGLVVGVDRVGHRDELIAAGADLVVSNLTCLMPRAGLVAPNDADLLKGRRDE